MTEAPPRVVRTARLVLRPFEPADEPAYAAIRSQPAVARFLAGGEAGAAEGAEKAAALVPAFAALWDEVGYGPWAAVEAATGRLIGHLGLRRVAEFQDRTEVLYALDPTAQGRGYAVEGARAALRYAFDVLDLPEVVAFARPENLASLKVMERIGMARRPGLIEVFGVQAVLCVLTSTEFRKETA
ncbi:MAG: GNAT family N-acetyltransferase [Pseudomonadota bacterium]